MSKFEVLSLIISILAAIISTISLVRTRELAKEQLELEKVTAELSRLQIESITEQKTEKTKPKFNVKLIKLGEIYKFFISNKGQGSAYNVNFELIDCEDSPLFDSELTEIFPYQEMKPSSEIKLLASLHMNSPSKYQSRISWEDKSGKKHDEIFWTSL